MSNDAKSILGIPQTNKDAVNKYKLEEANRALFKFTGGIPQLVPARKDQLNSEIEKWTLKPFKNEAREDDLSLTHWQKTNEAAECYPYSKLNKKVEIIKFTSDEYDRMLHTLDNSWSKEETFSLWDLLERFDLRFIVVADYIGYKRTVEEIKLRYYSISKELLLERGEKDHPIVQTPYNYEYDVKRKANMERTFLQTFEQHKKEQLILEDIKVLDGKIKKAEKEQKNLEQLISYSKNNDQPLNPSMQGGSKDRGSLVYLRSHKILTALPIPEKAQKKLDTALTDLNVVPKDLLPIRSVHNKFDDLRKLTLKYLMLLKHIQKKEREKQYYSQKLQAIPGIKFSAPIPKVMSQNQEILAEKKQPPSIMNAIEGKCTVITAINSMHQPETPKKGTSKKSKTEPKSGGGKKRKAADPKEK